MLASSTLKDHINSQKVKQNAKPTANLSSVLASSMTIPLKKKVRYNNLISKEEARSNHAKTYVQSNEPGSDALGESPTATTQKEKDKY